MTGSVLTTVSDGFNSAISLSATGAPNGTTVSFVRPRSRRLGQAAQA